MSALYTANCLLSFVFPGSLFPGGALFPFHRQVWCQHGVDVGRIYLKVREVSRRRSRRLSEMSHAFGVFQR